MSKIAITEEDSIHKEWYQEAEKIRIDTLDGFVKKLVNEYEHDYGTIVHAMTAAVGATISAMNHSEQGGITGFQASALMWQILEKEFHVEHPSKLVRYENMLFPCFEEQFTAIPPDVWVWLRERAKFLLDDKPLLDESVKRHLKTVVEGVVPFGYKIAISEENTYRE